MEGDKEEREEQQEMEEKGGEGRGCAIGSPSTIEGTAISEGI